MIKILKEGHLFSIVDNGLARLKKVREIKEKLHFLRVEKKGTKIILSVRNKISRETFKIEVSFINLEGEDNLTYTAGTNGKSIILNYGIISDKAEDPFKKCVNSFMHEMIHIYQERILGYQHQKKDTWEKWHGESFKALKDLVNDEILEAVKLRSIEKFKKYINPSPTLKAQELFEAFNQYPASKVKNLKLPIGPNSTLVRLGDCEGIEYASDKMIFKTDQKTGKRKKRTYIHSFTEHGKSPALYSNEDGTLLILYSSKNPIEINEAGII